MVAERTELLSLQVAPVLPSGIPYFSSILADTARAPTEDRLLASIISEHAPLCPSPVPRATHQIRDIRGTGSGHRGACSEIIEASRDRKSVV